MSERERGGRVSERMRKRARERERERERESAIHTQLKTVTRAINLNTPVSQYGHCEVASKTEARNLLRIVKCEVGKSFLYGNQRYAGSESLIILCQDNCLNVPTQTNEGLHCERVPVVNPQCYFVNPQINAS